MRGPVNTPITLTIVRKGVDEPFDVKVVRDIIRINAVKAHNEGDVAYIKVTTFNEQTHANLVKAIDEAKKTIGKNLKGYIIDLRNNPGGLLDQAIAVSDDFLEQGAIVLTKGRNNEETQRAQAHPGDVTDGKKIVVLINGGSASASEIVAGALQDHKRATVIGTRSFGKGSVQTIIPLGANGAIRLTTARYYTPSNRSIQAKGIDPDILVEEELPTELKAKAGRRKARGEASLRGHLKNPEDEGRGRQGVKETSGPPPTCQGAREGHPAAVRPLLPARRAATDAQDGRCARSRTPPAHECARTRRRTDGLPDCARARSRAARMMGAPSGAHRFLRWRQRLPSRKTHEPRRHRPQQARLPPLRRHHGDQPRRGWCGSAAAPTRPARPRGAGTWWQMPQGGIDKGEDPPLRPCASSPRRPASPAWRCSARARAGCATTCPPHLVGKAWDGQIPRPGAEMVRGPLSRAPRPRSTSSPPATSRSSSTPGGGCRSASLTADRALQAGRLPAGRARLRAYARRAAQGS